MIHGKASTDGFLCKNYKMEYIQNNAVLNTTINGCLKKNIQPQFISKSCLNTKCSLIKKIKKKKWKIPMPYPRQGSPHFQVCYEIGGTPSIVSIIVEKKRKFSLCRMKDSFIDAYTLMFHVKKKMDRQKRAIKRKKTKSMKLKI